MLKYCSNIPNNSGLRLQLQMYPLLQQQMFLTRRYQLHRLCTQSGHLYQHLMGMDLMEHRVHPTVS